LRPCTANLGRALDDRWPVQAPSLLLPHACINEIVPDSIPTVYRSVLNWPRPDERSAVDADNLGPNIRRLAGAHDVPLERLAEEVGLSRAGMMKLVGKDPPKSPKASTVMEIARVFGVTVEDLYADPEQLFFQVSQTYSQAPIRKLVIKGNVRKLPSRRAKSPAKKATSG
jgi:transcriptional regulator with XRE-family HTH domain